MLHSAVGAEYAAMTGAMKALIAGEVRDCATEVRADSAGYREALVPVAEDENLFLDEKGRRAKGKIRRAADLE